MLTVSESQQRLTPASPAEASAEGRRVWRVVPGYTSRRAPQMIEEWDALAVSANLFRRFDSTELQQGLATRGF
jgi:hypothetical protein